MSNRIAVTAPSLPPLEAYTEYLEQIWTSGILTHNGPLVQQLEKRLEVALGLRNLVAVTSGTIALQLAIRALGLKGEIITTPFSWIASLSSIMWEYCQPVFVDIDPDTFNIDPNKIEEAINENTSAILAVHVFGNPCDVTEINKIAKNYSLKVVYDAAHAMFVNWGGNSILSHGDISATSFHATKIFQTGEGGACVTADQDLYNRVKRLRFFGHNDRKDIVDIGFNGKMTELHAAMGLASLQIVGKTLVLRKEKYLLYKELLSECPRIGFQQYDEKCYNFSYMPIVLEDEETLERLLERMGANGIFPRRYFFPSLSTLKLQELNPKQCKISETLSKRILCLPLYDSLGDSEIYRICEIVLTQLKDQIIRKP